MKYTGYEGTHFENTRAVDITLPPSASEIDNDLGFKEPGEVTITEMEQQSVALKMVLCWLLIQRTEPQADDSTRDSLLKLEYDKYAQTVQDIKSLKYEDLRDSQSDYDKEEYRRIKAGGGIISDKELTRMLGEAKKEYTQAVDLITSKSENSLSRQSIAHRVAAAVYTICPELLSHKSLSDIGRQCGGVSKQTLHKLVSDFEKQFNFRHSHSKTDSAKQAYREAAEKSLIDNTPLLAGFEELFAE